MEVFLKHLRVYQKCCCCSLRVGTLLILWTWICFALLTIFGSLFAWSNISSDLDTNVRYRFYDKGRREKDSQYFNVDTPDLQNLVYCEILCLCLVCYIFLFQLCPHIFALYSIRKKNPSYLEPYLLMKITELLFGTAAVITLVLSLLIVIANNSTMRGGQSVAMFVSGIFTLIYAVINYYCTSVVYSYYVMMKEEQKNEEIAAELTAILPSGGSSLLQNPSASSQINNQPTVNDMSSLPIKNYQITNKVVGPSFSAMENQPFMQHKESNLKCN